MGWKAAGIPHGALFIGIFIPFGFGHHVLGEGWVGFGGAWGCALLGFQWAVWVTVFPMIFLPFG